MCTAHHGSLDFQFRSPNSVKEKSLLSLATMSSFDNARAFLESGAEGDSFLALPPYSEFHKVPEDLPNFRPLFVLSEDEDRSDLSLAEPDASSSLYFFNYWSIALLTPFLCFPDRFARTDIKYIVWLLDHSLIAFVRPNILISV